MIESTIGKGFDYDKHGNNRQVLAAMKERMSLAGGTCSISSEVGQGTSVQICIAILIDL